MSSSNPASGSTVGRLLETGSGRTPVSDRLATGSSVSPLRDVLPESSSVEDGWAGFGSAAADSDPDAAYRSASATASAALEAESNPAVSTTARISRILSIRYRWRAGSRRGVQVGAGCHRALDLTLQPGEFIDTVGLGGVSVENRGDDAEVYLRGARFLLSERVFGLPERLSRHSLGTGRRRRCVSPAGHSLKRCRMGGDHLGEHRSNRARRAQRVGDHRDVRTG